MSNLCWILATLIPVPYRDQRKDGEREQHHVQEEQFIEAVGEGCARVRVEQISQESDPNHGTARRSAPRLARGREQRGNHHQRDEVLPSDLWDRPGGLAVQVWKSKAESAGDGRERDHQHGEDLG